MNVERFVLGQLETNTYIAADPISGEAVIIDPADNSAEFIKRVAEMGGKVKSIILTHCHFDHLLALDTVKRITNAPICIHRDDAAACVDSVGSLYEMFYRSNEFRGVIPDVLLSDGDVISFGKSQVRVIHTPGHSPGSACFVGNGVIFSGDTLFKESYGRTDFPGGNIKELCASVKKLMDISGDLAIYPGHGEFTTLAHERRFNPLVRYYL